MCLNHRAYITSAAQYLVQQVIDKMKNRPTQLEATDTKYFETLNQFWLKFVILI